MVTYFEDIEIGRRRELGSYRVEKEEILDFGRRYDPQPFHVDETIAAGSPFGGLVASGWHTTAIAMRLMVDRLYEDGSAAASLGSPGADEVRWHVPVRPGDVLGGHTEILDKRELASRPDRGLIRLRVVLTNQHGEDVMSLIALGFVRRRPAAEPS